MTSMYYALKFKMPEVGMWLEGSGVKHRMVIWLTELPFSHTGVIKVTNELNEDISYFTYLGERETERKKEKEGNGKKQNHRQIKEK